MNPTTRTAWNQLLANWKVLFIVVVMSVVFTTYVILPLIAAFKPGTLLPLLPDKLWELIFLIASAVLGTAAAVAGHRVAKRPKRVRNNYRNL